MLDIAVAYNRYRFLGNEFLTWLWYAMENEMETIRQCDPDLLDLNVGNRMVLENRLANGKENITIKGDAAGLEEALLALRKGALITDMHMIYKSGSLKWQFAVKGENLSFSGLKLPESGPIESSDDKAGAVLDKIYLYDKSFQLIDKLYQAFIKVRLSEKWMSHVVPGIKKWISTDPNSPDSSEGRA